MSLSRSILLAAPLLSLAVPPPLAAQEEGTLGINLVVTGSPQIGVTWQASPGFAIRPSFRFDWFKTTSPFGGEIETTIYGADVDLLFRTSQSGRLTTYLGLGGGLFYFNASGNPLAQVWLGRTLVGGRFSVVDRIALFGELGFQYESGDDQLPERFRTATVPIGVLVFLN